MPTLNPKRVAQKLQAVINAWQTLRPTKTFAGMTLEQFKAKVQPSQDARGRLLTLQTQTKEVVATRHESDSASLEQVQFVVNAVKGDPTEGETSGVYAAIGYVPKNQRRSGLSRKGTTTPPIVQTTVAI